MDRSDHPDRPSGAQDAVPSTPRPATVEAYLAGLSPERRAGMEALRRTINAAAPRATETIAYLMPALRMDGRFLVSYAAFKHHYSLFPATDAVIEGLGDEVRPYLAGKGTIRFSADRPLPLELVSRIVGIRLQEHETRERG